MERKQVQLSQNESIQVLWNTLDDEQSAQLMGGSGVIIGSGIIIMKPGTKVAGVSTSPDRAA